MVLDIISKKDLLEMEARLLVKLSEIFDARTSNGSDTREWLNEKEAREYLRVSKSTLQKYRREGIIPFSQYERKIMFRKEDLDAFLTQNYSK